jgi:hypothetical protein
VLQGVTRWYEALRGSTWGGREKGRGESREQRAESREQRTDNTTDSKQQIADMKQQRESPMTLRAE